MAVNTLRQASLAALRCPAWGVLALLLPAACSGGAGSAQVVEGVSVSPSAEVRQGQSSIEISYGRKAGGLSNVTHVDLEGLTVAIDPRSSSDDLLLEVTVPHGAAPGSRSLTFDADGATTTLAAVLEVTPITADPSGADSQLGTTHSPFRSLKQALAVAGSSDTCVLAAGTYAAESGETWGYAVPDGVTLTGDSSKETVLEGSVSTAPSTTGKLLDALEPMGTLTVQQLALADFDVGVDLKQAAQVSLEDVAIRGAGKGVLVEAGGSALRLTRGSVDSAAGAIEVAAACDGCSVTVDGTKLTNVSMAPLIQISEDSHHGSLTFKGAELIGSVLVGDRESTMTIEACHFMGNGNAALNFSGAQLDVTGSDFQANSGPYGINFNGGKMSLVDSTVEGNEYSVYQLAGTSKVRGSKFTGYSSIGYYYAKGDLDLGTATEPGNNTFEGVGAHAFGLYVDTDTTPLTCSNTTFDGMLPEPGTVTADTEIVSQDREYLLVPGRMISFFRVP